MVHICITKKLNQPATCTPYTYNFMLSGTDDILNGAITMPASGKNNRSLVIKESAYSYAF
jgi:hypothetical protein